MQRQYLLAIAMPLRVLYCVREDARLLTWIQWWNTTTNQSIVIHMAYNQCYCNTPPLVEMSITSWWKTIEDMVVPSSELAASLAWYSRMLSIRRGPRTNICMTCMEVVSCRNGDEWSTAEVSHRLAYPGLWRERGEVIARNSSKANTCRTSADKDNHTQISSSPHKVKYVSFY